MSCSTPAKTTARRPSSGSAPPVDPVDRRHGGPDPPHRGDAEVDELDRRAGRRVPVADAVSLVERGVDRLERALLGDGDVDRVLLPDVAHVGRALEVAVARRDVLALEQRVGLVAQGGERTRDLALVELGERADRSSARRRGAGRSAASPRPRTFPGSTARSPRRSRAPPRARPRASGRRRRRRPGRTRAGRFPAAR